MASEQFSAKIDGKVLVLRVPLVEHPGLSKSGKTVVVATTHGNVRTDAQVGGKLVTVGVNAYVAP